jgi:hypothetical protein
LVCGIKTNYAERTVVIAMSETRQLSIAGAHSFEV